MPDLAMVIGLSILGAYVTASITLLVFPQLLHKKKKISFNPVHISHRGGAGEAIENSIEAFQHAVESGTEMLELDVHLTLDGEVVVVHDANLKRLCGEDVNVRDVNFAKLPPLRSVLRADFAPMNPPATSSSHPYIPRLREVFEKFPTTPINIDIKADNDRLIVETVKLIEEFKRAPITVCSSAMGSVSNRIHTQAPHVSQFFSVTSYYRFVLAFYVGLLPFMNVREDFLELPLPWSLRHLARNRTHTVLLWLLDAITMNRIFFFHMRRRGVKILFWVLNDEESINRAFRIGGTGVMTDYPTMLTTLLNENSKLKPSGPLISE